MDTFLLSLLLVAAIALGGREQLIVAHLSDALAVRRAGLVHRPVPLLVIALVCAALSAGVMVYAAPTIAALLPRRAAQMLVAFALAIAAFELAWPVRVKPTREPTRSLGAIALVLVWRQLGDGARFAIFALAAGATYPLTAFIGGALGGATAVVAGWTLGHARITRWPLVWIRRGMAACMIVAAIFIGLDARYGAD